MGGTQYPPAVNALPLYRKERLWYNDTEEQSVYKYGMEGLSCPEKSV